MYLLFNRREGMINKINNFISLHKTFENADLARKAEIVIMYIDFAGDNGLEFPDEDQIAILKNPFDPKFSEVVNYFYEIYHESFETDNNTYDEPCDYVIIRINTNTNTNTAKLFVVLDIKEESMYKYEFIEAHYSKEDAEAAKNELILKDPCDQVIPVEMTESHINKAQRWTLAHCRRHNYRVLETEFNKRFDPYEDSALELLTNDDSYKEREKKEMQAMKEFFENSVSMPACL